MKRNNGYILRTVGKARLFSAFSLTTIRAFVKDRSGAIAILMGLMFPVLLGAIGLGIEVGYWYDNRRDIQISADTAAISGAYDLADGGTVSTVTTAATNGATRNGFDGGVGAITVNVPPTSGAYTADASAVEVSITSPVNLMFTNFFLADAVQITSRAVATAYNTGNTACVLALDGISSSTVLASGSADISMEGCEVASNSSDASAINVQGAATLSADCVTTVGGVSGTVDTTCGSADTGARPIDDPFAKNYTMPPVGPCSETSYAPGTATIDPTVYGSDTMVICDGLTINSTDVVTFEPGTYVIAGGEFRINGGATVTGSGVTFIFTENVGNWASATINGGGTVDIEAPTSGDFKGMLFYQDPATPTASNNGFTFNGDSNTELTGAIYARKNDVAFSGGNELDDAGCLLIVALTVTFNGDADFENDCDAYIDNPIFTSTAFKLVE